MKLYNGLSPNGARVQVFLAEKGIEIPTVEVNVLEGQTRTAEFQKLNSLGQIPVLETNDGTVITESIAICRYLEALNPEPKLFGATSLEQARIEMWARRMERQIFDTIGTVGLHEMPLFADQIEQIPEYAASMRRQFFKKLKWLDEELSDGRAFIAGDVFSVADITGIAALMVCVFLDLSIPDDVKFVKAWAEKMQARPSWPMQ